MSSKLLGVDDARSAQPLVWGGANGAAPPAAPGQQAKAQPGATEQPRTIKAQQARIQELERELESRPRQAYQQGHNEGQAAGQKAALARLDPVMAKLAETIKELAGWKKRYLLDAEEDAVRLVVAVARKVLHRELSVDPDALLGVVKAAFERMDAREVHRIRMNPEDVPQLQRHLVQLGVPPRVELIGDTTLERGAVIFETARGSLDASVSSQLKEIERGLVDLVRRNP